MDETAVGARPPLPNPAAPPPPYPPDEPDGPLGRGMLLALIAIALAVVAALAGWLVTHRGSTSSTTTTVAVTTTPPTSSVAAASTQLVAVPQIVGLSKQAALIQLGRAGLKPQVQVRTTGPHDGLVVEQRPVRAEKVPLGSPVIVLLDPVPSPAPKAKPKPSPAPAAKPKAATTAQTTTAAQQTTTQAQTTTTVTTTTTAAQTTTTPAQVSMPDVSGKPEAAAVDAVDQAGLLVSLVFVPSKDDLGTVEAQSKPAGTTLPARTPVQLNLSGGTGKFPPETVPNVIGSALHAAVSTLNGAQLRLIYVKLPVTARSEDGKIVQQTPLAGDKAPQHAQVLVYLGVLQK